MEDYDVDRIWSYSRMSSYLNNDPWEYRMLYLERKPRVDNVYTYWGTLAHDIIQDMYDGKHSYEDMIDIFEKKIEDWEFEVASGEKHLKFMSDSVERGYIDNLRHYFRHTSTFPYEIKNETPVMLTLKDKVNDENIVFVGYVDSEYVDEDGILNIVDYKTSSNSGFSGEKLKEKAQQLMLYSMAISQYRGIPIEKIRMRFDMMKYLEVSYLQKNGKWRSSAKERSKWVQSMEKRIYKALVDDDIGGLDPFEAEEQLEIAILNNSIKDLPTEVQDLFKISNYYIDVTMTQEEADELEQLIINTVREIKEKEKGDWEVEFPEPKIDQKNQFYYTVLAPNLLKYHQGWQESQALIRGKSNNANEEIMEEFFK